MKPDKQSPTQLKLVVAEKNIIPFTTLLQSGMTLLSKPGESIGVFLLALPDFTEEYITEKVQTIFFDGNAVDDLEKRFEKDKHTIALSAAMPGLAGAIFRRNSLCAALRSAATMNNKTERSTKEVQVYLKLFNSIAQEKGIALFAAGGFFNGKKISDFFIQRKELLHDISTFMINGIQTKENESLLSLESNKDYFLQILTD